MGESHQICTIVRPQCDKKLEFQNEAVKSFLLFSDRFIPYISISRECPHFFAPSSSENLCEAKTLFFHILGVFQ